MRKESTRAPEQGAFAVPGPGSGRAPHTSLVPQVAPAWGARLQVRGGEQVNSDSSTNSPDWLADSSASMGRAGQGMQGRPQTPSKAGQGGADSTPRSSATDQHTMQYTRV